ncbi:MAG TPA: AsnC family transcriptional regulator [Candidatus Altiarchaeales archaeon]|nr:AsnC family transcriptional regulator [Candidatus Altiarchaeales archaeon]
MKIDNLDLNIIKHLQSDARLSFRELGRKLGVPHTTVFTRAERLVKRGIIKNFSAILHPRDLGLQVGYIFVDAPPAQSKEIANRIAEFDEARHVFRTFDGKIIAKIVVPEGHHGFEDFLARLNIGPLQAYSVHDVVKFDYTIPEGTLKGLSLYKEK